MSISSSVSFAPSKSRSSSVPTEFDRIAIASGVKLCFAFFMNWSKLGWIVLLYVILMVQNSESEVQSRAIE